MNSKSAMWSRPKDRYDYRVTIAGLILVVSGTLIGLAAINIQRALLFIIVGLMAGAFVVSIWVARRTLSGVRVCRDLPDRAFANQVVHLGYRLGLRRRGCAIGLELEEVTPPAELQSVGAFCLYLPGGQEFRSGSRFVVRRRGRYVLSRLRLSTSFPFSLVRARRDIDEEARLVVWPALGRLRADVLVRGAAEVSDAAPSQVHSGSDEFFGVREYRQGDNLRWIHWKRTASAGVPVVREMSKPRPDVLYVVFDTQVTDDSPPALARRERLIRFACTLIEQAFHREYRVGLALARAEGVVALPAAAGRGHRAALLDALAEIDEATRAPLEATLTALPRAVIRDAHVVAVGPHADRLAGVDALPGACRRLTIVSEANVGEFFDDNPHSDGRDEKEGG